MKNISAKVKHFLHHSIWLDTVEHAPFYQRTLYTTLRFLHALRRDINEGQLTLYAMSLVYTTLLSLVPLLAVSFSILHAFGVHNQIEPFLLQFLEPLGEKGQEISINVINFVENMDVGVLGAVGLAMLLYTVISTLTKIETAFNFIWRQPKTRSFLRRAADYTSIVLIAPVLVFSALGLIASMSSHTLVQNILSIEPLGSLFISLGQYVPYLLIIIAFTLAYLFMPNTNVSVKAALIGGGIAGVLWKFASWLFALFVANSGNYDAIYSGLAILIFFIIWLNLNWLILLFGAQIAFYIQNPQFLKDGNKHHNLNPADAEILGLIVIHKIISNYSVGNPPITTDQLARDCHVPDKLIEKIVSAFIKSGIIVETSQPSFGYTLGKPIDKLPQHVIIHAIRHNLKSSIEINHLNNTEAQKIQTSLDSIIKNNLTKTIS